MNTIFGNKIITALILTLLIFAAGAPAGAKVVSAVAPAVLGFGSQAVGTASIPALVTFSNNTKSSMKIVGVSLSQTQFTYSGPKLPVNLSPGQAFTGRVTFDPTAAKAYSDTLRFTRANGTTETSSLSGTGVQSTVPGGPVLPPTSLLLTVAPCDSNFNCVAGTAVAVGQWVSITAHVVYTGTTNPTGTLCIMDNGSPANCGLTPAVDENWFVNGLASGTHNLSATYAGNSVYGASTSGIATLVVGSATPPPQVVAPTITLQPLSQTVTPGKTATFTVQVTGTAPLTYQWSKSGTVIAAATSASYTTPATTLSDNSAKFVLVVSNSAGTSTSSAAVLSVSSATPVLTTNPSSLTFGNMTVGTSNTLSIALTNSGTSNVSISNTSVSGAGFTASGMSGTILTPGQSANLNVTFAPSGAGAISGSVSVTSNAATAKITLSGNGIQPAMTSITVTPANQTVSVGNQVQYQAMDNLGNDVTSSVSWSSSDSTIVTISSTGLATGVANGNAMVAATK
jgi:plastocyanin